MIQSILAGAVKHHYAVPHFNVSNLETMQAVFNACKRMRSPAFVATSESAVSYASLGALVSLFNLFACRGFALHLDHGKDFRVVKECIKAGYTSVMVDASHLPFGRNVLATKKVVSLAHRYDVAVEAELGTIGGREDYVKGRIIYTNPDEAEDFVEESGCDSLAVAVGTSHGAYKFPGKSRLDMDVLRNVKRRVKVPLVLHGASSVPQNVVEKANRYGARIKSSCGVSRADIRSAVRNGISKVNIDTDLRIAFNAGIREYLAKNRSDFDYRKILGAGRAEIENAVAKEIVLLGSGGRL